METRNCDWDWDCPKIDWRDDKSHAHATRRCETFGEGGEGATYEMGVMARDGHDGMARSVGGGCR